MQYLKNTPLCYENAIDSSGQLEFSLYDNFFWLSKNDAIELIKILKEKFDLAELPPKSKKSKTEMLDNLLAVIHRDGGHYVKEHGLDKACADAEALILNMFHNEI